MQNDRLFANYVSPFIYQTMQNQQMKSIFQHQSAMADMSFVVREYLQPHFTSPFHFHDSYELIIISRSHGKLYVGNKILNFSDGEIYLFGPGLSHCFLNDRSFKETGEIAHAIVIFFKEDFLGKDFFTKAELAHISDLLQLSAVGLKLELSDPWLHDKFHAIVQSKGMEALLSLLQILHRLSHMRAHLHSINSTIPKIWPKQGDSDRLEKVIRYIIDHFKEEPNSKEAASVACMNEAAFCRYFKRRTEKTFSQFVNYVRVTHATNLLTQKKWSIAGICYECGYKNISYFNRQFKNVMGVTPMEYRMHHSNANGAIIEEAI